MSMVQNLNNPVQVMHTDTFGRIPISYSDNDATEHASVVIPLPNDTTVHIDGNLDVVRQVVRALDKQVIKYGGYGRE